MGRGAGGGRLQQRRHGAEQLLARGAGDLRIGRVHVEHAVVGVGDQEAFVQVLEQARGQTLALLRRLLLGHVDQHAEQSRRPVAAVALGDHRMALEPAPAALGGAHAQLDAKGFVAALERIDGIA